MFDPTKRTLTFKEELANVITHGMSALGVLILMPILYMLINKNVYVSIGNTKDIIGIFIFLVSIFSMLFMSTLYHFIKPETELKFLMRKMDHIFIFVAIAGSYTPLALSIIWDIPGYGKPIAIVMLILQWSCVIVGAMIKLSAKKGKFNNTIPIYLIMGWIIVLILPVFYRYSNPYLFWSIFIGGVIYSIGAIFLALDNKIKYMHMIWHFFVTFGAIAHIIGICFFLH